MIKSIDSINYNIAGINAQTIHNSSRNYFGFVGSDRNYNSMVSTGAIEFIKNEEEIPREKKRETDTRNKLVRSISRREE